MIRTAKSLWLVAVLGIAATPKLLPPKKSAVVLPPNTNTIGIHAVWMSVPFADSYDLAWGTNGIYSWTLNTVTTGAVFRWPQTNPLPSIVVRANVAGQTSDWSAPFAMEKYIHFALIDTSSGSELAGITITNPIQPMQLVKAVAVTSNNYPTLP